MDSSPSQADTFVGAATFGQEAGDFNPIAFMIAQALAKVDTVTVVKVVALGTGAVDVQPLVSQVDGQGGVMPHGTLHNLPVFRLQGGANAVIVDPAVGDIGVACFASRDISTVKKTKAVGPPGSKRRFDMADGFYFGGVLNGAATQYLVMDSAGVRVVSNTMVTLTAPAIKFDGPVEITGNLSAAGVVTLGGVGATLVKTAAGSATRVSAA